MIRLHVGCGTVFLRDWLNVDLPVNNVFLSKERPDLVEMFETTEDKYYARHENQNIGEWRGEAKTLESVCDAYGNFDFLPARPNSVEQVLTRQCFEHLDRSEAKRAFVECERVLIRHGLLRIDVPDPEETLKKYRETGDAFYVRHLFGPRLTEFGFHTHYTRQLLTEMADDAGFVFELEEPNIHPYPAFCLRFSKL